MSLQQWSTVAANNSNAATNVNMTTGSAPSTVHPSIRQMMADVATWYAAPEWLAQNDTPTYVSATQFTVPGNKTSVYSVNRRVQAVVTAGTVQGTISATAFTSLTTVTVTWDSGSLDAGLSLVYVGILQNQLAHVTISGGAITGVTIDNSAIGGTTPAAGTFTNVNVTSSAVPANGIYLPAANTLGFATASTKWLSINSTGNIVNVAPTSGVAITANAAAAAAGVAAIQAVSGGTFGHMNGGNDNAMPWLASINSADYTAATFGWLWINDATNGNLTLYRRAGSASNSSVLQIARASGSITTIAPSSAVTALTVNGVSGADPVLISFADAGTRNLNLLNTSGTGTAQILAQGANGGTQAVLTAGNGFVNVGANTNHGASVITNGTARIAVAAAGGVTLNTPTSGNHQFNGLTQYSDGTTNAEIGWRNIPSNAQSVSYTLVAADRGRNVRETGAATTVTLPISVFNADDCGLITNRSGGAITVAITAGGTLQLAGTATTGSRTLADKGVLSWRYDTGGATPLVLVSGPGVT